MAAARRQCFVAARATVAVAGRAERARAGRPRPRVRVRADDGARRTGRRRALAAPVLLPVWAAAAQTNAQTNIVITAESRRNANGVAAAEGDLVVVAYKGMLVSDHSVFQDTRRRPVAFVLGGPPFATVTRGLMLGVAGMQPGETRTVFVPAALAFGSGGAAIPPASCEGPFCNKAEADAPPTVVPPDADVEYKLELLKVVPSRNFPQTMVR